MHRYVRIALALLVWPTLLGCEPRDVLAGDGTEPPPEQVSNQAAAPSQPKTAAAPKPVERAMYPWLDAESEAKLVPLESRFPAPDDYQRVLADDESFAEFLRGLPVRADREQVYAYDGRKISAPSAAVVAMDVGDRNLQQCADTAIRLHAEYLWSVGQKDDIAYHFTSGDRSAWTDWAAGERFRIRGSRVERVNSGSQSRSRDAFRTYLDHVFMYAGTRSLRFDSEPAKSITPGTFFVAPGSPGHAVIVLDIAENDAGERVALLGQGFMPAQELHVLEDRRGSETIDGVWWRLPEDNETLNTPSWQPFRRSDARNFATSTE